MDSILVSLWAVSFNKIINKTSTVNDVLISLFVGKKWLCKPYSILRKGLIGYEHCVTSEFFRGLSPPPPDGLYSGKMCLKI